MKPDTASSTAHISDARAYDELALLRFGPLEGRILRALWSFEEVTLADLQHLLAEPTLSTASLRAVLDRMHLKRLIHLRKVHRLRYYRASLERRTFLRLLRTQLSGFLGEDGMCELLGQRDDSPDRVS